MMLSYEFRLRANVLVAHHVKTSWASSKLVIGEVVWIALPGSGDCQGTSGP